MKIQNYALGKWVSGSGEGTSLFNAVTGDIIGATSSGGLDFEEMLHYGRSEGNSNLKKYSFHDRARMLKKLAVYLGKYKDEFYKISYMTGATKIDSWIDIEGGFGNLFIYSGKGRRELPDKTFFTDGDLEPLSKGGSFVGQHIYTHMEGVAVHINAYNFPVWGMLEKIAVNLLAGMPAIVKPATVTCFLTEAVVRRIVESKILPEGSIQLICGSASGLVDSVNSLDVVTFTGSASTGQMLKANPNVIAKSVRFNMEADSLNCSILGQDANSNTPEFKLFIKEVAKEMTVKAGQKCTAIRRIIVPENIIDDVQKALASYLDKVVIGNPTDRTVKMGALASKAQLKEVKEKIQLLKSECEQVYKKSLDNLVDAKQDAGAFMGCILLRNNSPFEKTIAHDIEAFGPVSTLIPYKDTEEAIKLAKMGKGSLVASIISYDPVFVKDVTLEIASQHGRILVLDRDCAGESTGHGSPLPHLIHGGPGRAGGGEEMGGIRGVKHYMQRVAVQGTATTITNITDVYHQNAKEYNSIQHPFKNYYEDLKIGQTLVTHKRTVTETDIVNFANTSGDNFYAHTDITSLEGTIFERRVAHGYFVLSAAAGLFVDPAKGPVLANYGIDFCRFTQPVYAGDTIWVKLTCKEKIDKEARRGEQPSGVVKWHVEVLNQNNETVALVTILTLVSKKGETFIELSRSTIKRYLDTLSEDTALLWGNFTPQQMVEHLSESLNISMGKVNEKTTTPEDKIEAFQKSLYNNIPMPKNFQLSKYEKGLPVLKQSSLQESKTQLLDDIDAFFAYYEASPEAKHDSSVFGTLDFGHWKRLHTKHFTHHFKQFNLIK